MAECGLEPGRSAYDVAANEQCVRRISKLYREKGHRHAKVTLASGSKTDQRDVIFRINEGPKVLVNWREFRGNRDVRSAVLKTHLETKSHILWIGGLFDPETLERDVSALEQYYQQLGYFDVAVKAIPRESEDRSRIRVLYDVKEGALYKVRSIRFEGNEVLTTKALSEELELTPGDRFLARELNSDLTMLKNKYDSLGRAFARVEALPEFDEKPGIVDLVYEIDEDEVKYIGSVNIHIRGDQPHTRHSVARHQATRFLVPGELFRAADLKKTRDSLNGNRLWDNKDPASVNVRAVDGRDYLAPSFARGQQARPKPIAEDLPPLFHDALTGRAESDVVADYMTSGRMRTALLETSHTKPGRASGDESEGDTKAGVTSGHSVKPAFMPVGSKSAPAAKPVTNRSAAIVPAAATTSTSPNFRSAAPAPAAPLTPAAAAKAARYQAGLDDSASYALAYMRTPPPAAFDFGRVDDRSNMVIRGQSPNYGAPSPYGPAPGSATQYAPVQYAPGTTAPGGYSPLYNPLNAPNPGRVRGQSFDRRGLPNPQNYLVETSPQGDPFGAALNNPPGFVDVDIDVTEAQTGRFMFGAGVNSDSGIVGQVSLEENNFDLFRPPRSWSDIANGRAFRGGGQSFRLEAVPGSQVSRYLVSWKDPFFLDTDFSFGVDGFYYQRFFDDWDEERLGGRLTVGRLLSRNWSASTSLRLESVTVDGVNAGDPQILQDVDGDNFLSTARLGLRYDVRDSALLPSTGYMVEGSYEQGFGDFVYPKFDLTAARYFTTYQRADGFGKHTLRFQGKFGYTGDDTPVFERYFAGGFQTFRGFDFRGVSPIAGATDARVGGQFMSIGTVEYMLPITANDNFKAVVFSDFGTVENDVSVDNFRASAGFGFRMSIPAMGPAPLAFDFAFPILSEEFDDERVFSFYIGFTP